MDNTTIKPSKTEAIKDFWNRKKGTLAVAATATTIGMVALMRAQGKQFQEFLKAQGMEEEFWKFIGADEEEIAEFQNNPL